MPQRRKLYDGLSDDFRIQGGRIYRRPVASIAALQWAAERADLSYGVFTLSLTEADQSRIQAEYEAYIGQRKGSARRETVHPAVDNAASTTPYIISDKDM